MSTPSILKSEVISLLTVGANKSALSNGREKDRNNREADSQLDRTLYHIAVNELSRTIAVCANSPLLSTRLDLVNTEKLKELLTTSWYNHRVMEAMLCLTNSIFYPSSALAMRPSQAISHYLTDLQKIGTPSTYGVVMEADAFQAKDVFVLKAPQDPNDISLTRELLIGLKLNELRAVCPNFVYTMGGFSCSRPVFSDGTVVSWCREEDAVQYIVYENVKPSEPLASYVSSCSIEQFISVFLQLVYALEAAYQLCRFTHYDLNSSNVLIRTVEGVSGPFLIPCRDGYIKSEVVATIIDYGMSHAELPVHDAENSRVLVSIAPYNLRQVGVDPENPYPMHDIHKVLLSSLQRMSASNNVDTFCLAKSVLGFFYGKKERTAKILEALKEAKDGHYPLGIMPAWQKVTYQELLDFLRNHSGIAPIMEKVLVELPELPTLSCKLTQCISGEEAIQLLVGEFPLQANNLLDFYLLVSGLYWNVVDQLSPRWGQRLAELQLRTDMPAREGTASQLEELLDTWPYQQQLAQAMDDYRDLYNAIRASLNGLIIPDPTQVEEYREAYLTLAAADSKLKELSDLAISMQLISRLYGVDLSTAYMEGVVEFQQLMNAHKQELKSHLGIIIDEGLASHLGIDHLSYFWNELVG